MYITNQHADAPGVWCMCSDGKIVRRLGTSDLAKQIGVHALTASSERWTGHTITAAADDDPYLVPWESDAIAFIGVETSDKRIIDGKVTFRSFPLPLMAAFQTSWGHDGSWVVGRIDEASVNGENVPASGVIDTLLPMGMQAARMVDTGSLNRVSVDPAGGTMETEITEQDDDGYPIDYLDHYTSLEIGGLTLVNVSAFAESKMRLTGPIPGLDEALTAAGDQIIRPFEQGRDDHGRFGEGSGGTTTAYGKSPGADSKAPFVTPNGTTMEFHGDKDFVIRGSNGSLMAVSDGLADQHAEEIGKDANPWVPMKDGDREFSAPMPVAYAAAATVNMHDGGTSTVFAGGDLANKDGSLREFATFDAADSFATSEKAAKGLYGSAAVTAAVNPLVDPPVWMYEDPQLSGRTRMTIEEPDENGHRRIFGHLAPWNECHIGIQNQCVMAPHSPSNYAWMQLGSLKCAEGCVIPIGSITFRGKHADKHLTARAATDHYDATCMQVADVAFGEDEHGVWYAGSLRTTATDEDVRELRASRLSGDWRDVNGELDLIAAHAVNTGGFPVYEEAIAADGSVQTIIASLDQGDEQLSDQGDQLLRKLLAPVFREQADRLVARVHTP